MRTYDKNGYRNIREGQPTAATEYQHKGRYYQLPGTGTKVRQALARYAEQA